MRHERTRKVRRIARPLLLTPHSSPLTVFVTGTDTGVGKTLLCTGLLKAAREQGLRVCGFKPVASGCRRRAGGLRNVDALALQKAAGTSEAYERINPYAFAPAIAPHLAARAAGRRVDTRRMDAAHRYLDQRYELLIVEGAGGWQVPLNSSTTFADWVAAHRWPVVLVVGMRLGCINHALLTAESIAARTPLAGWVANRLPPEQPAFEENLADLCRRLPAPLLGVLPEGIVADSPVFASILRRVNSLRATSQRGRSNE